MSPAAWLITAFLALGLCFHAARHFAWKRHREANFNDRSRVRVEESFHECAEPVSIEVYTQVWYELAKIIGIDPECLRRSDTIDEIRGPLHTIESHIDGVEELLAYDAVDSVVTFGDLVDAAIRFRTKDNSSTPIA